MAHPQIAAFARVAEGSAKATRSIAGQNTLLTRTIHEMAYDTVHDEIIVPQFYAFGLLTFRGDATGDEAPIRKIFGPKTGLKNPEKVAIDPVHGEIFVTQEDSVLVFAREAEGDVPPLRILSGPDTEFAELETQSAGVAVDPVNNVLIVSATPRGRQRGGESGGSGGRLLIFNRTDTGNIKPRAIIFGSNANIAGGQIAVYPPRGFILARTSMGRGEGGGSIIGVWSIHDSGDVAPRWTVGGPPVIAGRGGMGGVDVDAKHKTVIVSDRNYHAVLTYEFPEIF